MLIQIESPQGLFICEWLQDQVLTSQWYIEENNWVRTYIKGSRAIHILTDSEDLDMLVKVAEDSGCFLIFFFFGPRCSLLPQLYNHFFCVVLRTTYPLWPVFHCKTPWQESHATAGCYVWRVTSLIRSSDVHCNSTSVPRTKSLLNTTSTSTL